MVLISPRGSVTALCVKIMVSKHKKNFRPTTRQDYNPLASAGYSSTALSGS